MSAPKPKRRCLYCGKPSGLGKKGEHIVQEKIGGTLTLKGVAKIAVCPVCNTTFLSNLDQELCSRSYLSIIASQEIDSTLWQVWEVDESAQNLLVEARPAWHIDRTLSSVVCYPQITFERNGPECRGDVEEVSQFGLDSFQRVMFKAVENCFGRYRLGKNVLHFDKVRSNIGERGYRLAPRIFARHCISEIAENIEKQDFILRFLTEEDKRFALNWLSKLGERKPLDKWTQKPGSHMPSIAIFFDIGETMRALMKVGVNLIAAYCRNTPVSFETFSHPIRVIRRDVEVPPAVLASNGFVRAEDIQFLKGEKNEHTFLLVHVDGVWHVYSCFFGGRIGSRVRIPGPNHERWNRATIQVPIKSRDWQVATCKSQFLPPVHAEWEDSLKIMPTLKMQNFRSQIRIEVEQKKSL